MNRRDLMGLLTVAGLIPATAKAHIQKPINASWTGQPEYHVVYWFEGAPVDDFVEGGIYTRVEDAQAHIDRRVAEGKVAGGCSAGVILKLTHEQLCHALAEKRLGAMAVHMDRLMQLPADERQRDTEGFRMLYGTNSQFPIAVGRSKTS